MATPAHPPLPFTPPRPLRTARLDLRPVTDDDFAAVHAYLRLPEVCRYIRWGPLDEAGSRASVAAKAARTTLRAEGDSLQFAVVVRETGTLIGDVLLVLRSAAHRQASIGYVFHPAHHGHGYATEASRALLALGFDHLGLHRVQAELDARNAASAGLLERLGMRREAHHVENEFLDGEWTDEVVYAMLAREWEALRAADPTAAPRV
ncbi:GNAT family N-acetyltransferase [Streptomyces catenulae]|uniref:GNAT family protein n=1 Tax=Streptomyces catenulae TaxID=66875 RepID=A0ABV2Z5V0_9ACTN|nr:GNAT family protein [Streptomyces catenulae]